MAHKHASRLATTLHQAGVRTLVIGDVRDLRQRTERGARVNQKMHQWSAGQVRHFLIYKARRLGMEVVLQDERYTSRACLHRGTGRISGTG
jgi:putative transposase